MISGRPITFVALASFILLPLGALTQTTSPSIVDTEVRLRWLVPGDDGWVGNAVGYDLRATTDPILLTTLDGFLTATQAVGMPAPLPLGQVVNNNPNSPNAIFQTVRVRGLPVGRTVYFALRAMDESGNWSPLLPPISTVVLSGERSPGRVTEGDDIVYIDGTTETIDHGPPKDPHAPTTRIENIRIIVAPNPVDQPGKANLMLDVPESGTKLKIYDITGRIVWQTAPFPMGQYKLALSSVISNWTSGYYFAKVTSPSGKTKSFKFQITN